MERNSSIFYLTRLVFEERLQNQQEFRGLCTRFLRSGLHNATVRAALMRNESLRLAPFLNCCLLWSDRARNIRGGRRYVSLPGQRSCQFQPVGLRMFCEPTSTNLPGEQRSHNKSRRRRGDGRNRELLFSMRPFAVRDDVQRRRPHGHRPQS